MTWLLKSLKKLIKKKSFWFLVVVIIVIVIIISVVSKPKGVEYVTEKVTRGILTQTVSETGTLQAATNIDLNFKGNGTITQVNVKEGDEVKQGDILARLEAGNLEIQVRQSQANLDIARANLNRFLAGASAEDINVTQESVNNAQIAYENAKRNHEVLLEKLNAEIKTFQEQVESAQRNLTNVDNTNVSQVADARQNLLAALRNKVSAANTSLDVFDYRYNYVGRVSDEQAKSYAKIYYDSALTKLTSLETDLLKKDEEITDTKLDQMTVLAISMFEDINISLNSLYNAYTSTIVDANYSQTKVNESKSILKTEQVTNDANLSAIRASSQGYSNAKLAYTSSFDTAQSNYTNAQSSLSAAKAGQATQIANSQSALDSALGSYNLAKAQLDYKLAKPRSVDIAYYQAQVNQSQAALDLILSNFDDYMIKAPTDGIITFVNNDVGEQIGFGITDIAAAANSVISMLGNGAYEIEVDIPESDIVKLSIGNKANITLDAYGDDHIFTGKVIFIDLAQTNIQDVVYYKVKVALDDLNMDVKPGMTANIDILTEEKENVIAVPNRAIKQNTDGQKYVEILVNNQPKQVNVKTGLRGDQGTEIIEGLTVGQEIITYVKEK